MTHDTFIHVHRPDPPDRMSSRIHGIQALEPYHCRFILNTNPAEPIFCGQPVAHGKSWCPDCCDIVFQRHPAKVWRAA